MVTLQMKRKEPCSSLRPVCCMRICLCPKEKTMRKMLGVMKKETILSLVGLAPCFSSCVAHIAPSGLARKLLAACAVIGNCSLNEVP